MTGSNRTPPKPYQPNPPSHSECPECGTLYDTETLDLSLDGRTQCGACRRWFQVVRVPSTWRKPAPSKARYKARKKAEKAARDQSLDSSS